MPIPSPGSHGGSSPVDDDSPGPPLLLLPGSPLVPVVSGTTPEVVALVDPVAGSSVVVDGSTVVLEVGALVIVGSFVVVIPTVSDTEPVGVVVGVSLVPVPIVADASVALASVTPVGPCVPVALASVAPPESPQPVNRAATVLHPIHTRLCMPPSSPRPGGRTTIIRGYTPASHEPRKARARRLTT